MSRCAREKAESGIYHVMLRGSNKQEIFLCDTDRIKFLEILRICKEISGFDLLAYCLMGNHVHLLIKENRETLDLIMRRIGVRYVGWFNWKYDRCGHLFQDRFRSEPVEDDEYFMTVLRYIHQNPVKAYLCASVDEYRWSSYADYKNGGGLTDVAFAIKMVSQGELLEFLKQPTDEICMDDGKISKAAVNLHKFQKITGCADKDEFQNLSKNVQIDWLRKLRQAGLSRRYICEYTGCSDYFLRQILD